MSAAALRAQAEPDVFASPMSAVRPSLAAAPRVPAVEIAGEGVATPHAEVAVMRWPTMERRTPMKTLWPRLCGVKQRRTSTTKVLCHPQILFSLFQYNHHF